jgi:hypothetical protein
MNAQPRQWNTTLRVEKRYGVLRYVVEFSDGRLRASLYGVLPVGPPSVLKQAAWEDADEWLLHVRPPKQRPVCRAHFPKDKQHRKHHGRGRAIAA